MPHDDRDIHARRRLSRRFTLFDGNEPADAATCLAVVLAQARRRPAAVDNSDLLAALTLIDAVRADLESTEAALLGVARVRGLTWQALADATGVGSRQAVQQRAARLGVPADVRTASFRSGAGAA